jgi:hypothetical protein
VLLLKKHNQSVVVHDFLVSSMQVNGNLVSPMHVLANAEVVEIITYNVSIIIVLI